MRRSEQRAAILRASPSELRLLAELAIGRVLRLGSRPAQDGDVAEYEAARSVLLDVAEASQVRPLDTAPSWARDRLRGAAGD